MGTVVAVVVQVALPARDSAARHRRPVMYFKVTEHPRAEWAAQSRRVGIEAFPDDEAPQLLIRDRDSIYGHQFKNRIKNMGIEQVVTAARSPWQNPYAERIIDSL